MSAEQRRQPKRLLAGARVSGAFGDYYDNPNPDVRRRKRQRIYGTVVQACGERQYTVRFDCGKVIECFSNTLRVENRAASLPPSELQAAAEEVEAQGGAAGVTAAQIIEENEAGVQDAAEEEHLPEYSPDDDESEGSGPDGEAPNDADGPSAPNDAEGPDGAPLEEEPTQRPVGIVAEAPAEDLATYAGRKAAALSRIAALQGQVVTVTSGRTQQLVWKVIPESDPLPEDLELDPDVSEPGLKDLSQITRVEYKVLLAHLFIKLTFKVSLSVFFFTFTIHVTNIPFLLLLFFHLGLEV